MATFQVDIQKFWQNEYWTNVYFIKDFPDLLGASAVAADLVQMERQFHFDVVTFSAVRTSTITPGDFQYVTTQPNEPGLVNSTGNDFLPLFNVVRVDLTDAGFKRPERKYYRCPVPESWNSGGNLAVEGENTVEGAINGFIIENPGVLCGPNGEDILEANAYPRVGMRQLRRGSKRKATPII